MNDHQIIGTGKERKKITIYNSINDIPEEYFKSQEEQEETSTITTPSKYFYLTKEMYNETLERIKKDYTNNGNLLNIEWNEKENTAKGSNTYYVALINTIFKNQGIRTATQADLENILANNILPLKGFYEDSGIVLRSLTDPTEYLAKQISEQIAKIQRKKTANLQFPIYIPACELELISDPKSPDKLGFKVLTPGIYASILNSANQSKFSNSDIDPKTGFPTKIGNENRTLYTRSNSLSRVFLGRSLDLYSSESDLSYSNKDGRIICVKTSGDTE